MPSQHAAPGLGPDSEMRADVAPPRARLPRLDVRVLCGAVLLILLWVPSQLLWLGAAPFHTKGEPREALAARDVLRNGRWVLPRRNGVELAAKPPAFHWLAALAGTMRERVDEVAARLPSSLQSLLAILALYAALLRPLGPRAAWIAAAMTLTSFEWMRAATAARVDMTLTCGLTLAYAGSLRAWCGDGRNGRARLLFHGGMLWGALAKGPVGIAFPAVHALASSTLAPRRHLLRRLAFWRGMAVVLAGVGLWYVLAAFDGGPTFVRRQIFEENVFRLFGPVLQPIRERVAFVDRLLPFAGVAPQTVGHRHGVLYLGAMLLAGLLPWTCLLPAGVVAAWKQRATRSVVPFASVWVVLVFAVYAVAASKRGVYLLALYPALFTVVAAACSEHWWARLLRLTGVLLGAVAACGGVALLVAAVAPSLGNGLPLFLGEMAGPQTGRTVQVILLHLAPAAAKGAAWLAVAAALAALGALAARFQAALLAAGLLAAATCTVGAVTRAVILPAAAATSDRRPVVVAVRGLPGADHLSFYGHFDYGFVFYWGEDVPVYTGPLDHRAPRLLMIDEKRWRRMPPSARNGYEVVELPGRPPGVRLIAIQRAAPESMP